MADKLISATTSGDDLIFKVNVSGTPTEAMRILGTDGSVSGNITPSGITTETNMLTSASSTASGWTGTNATVTTTTTTGDLPLNGVVSTAIQIASSTLNGYAEVPFSIPEGLKNTKLKVEFYQRPAAGYVSNDFKVEVWNNGLTTEYSLSTDSSGTSGLSSMTGKYTTTFDTDTNTSYKLVVKRTVASAATINLSKVVIGPGIQPQGAVVEDWVSYTPVWAAAGTSVALGSGTLSGKYKRVGSDVMVLIDLGTAANTTYGSSSYTFSLPTGLTVDTTKITNLASTLGIARGSFGASANVVDGIVTNASSTTLAVVATDGATPAYWGQSQFTNSTAGQGIYIQATVPISEWSGSGTVNLAQNDVEYASNSNATNAAADTTSFAYGPAGSLIPNGAVGTLYTRRAQFQSPIQVGDAFLLEVNDGTGWVPMSERIGPKIAQSTSLYGANVERISGVSNAVSVFFNAQGYAPSGATYGSNGSAWSALAAWYWRVRKTSAGAAVGFGAATTTSSGLITTQTQSFAGIKDFTNGIKIASGSTLSYASTGEIAAKLIDGSGNYNTTTIYWCRVMNLVTLTVPEITLTSNTTSLYLEDANGNWPSEIRVPSTTQSTPILISSTGLGAAEWGIFQLTAGVTRPRIYRAAFAAFTGGSSTLKGIAGTWSYIIS
jgi:hypothetical protein